MKGTALGILSVFLFTGFGMSKTGSPAQAMTPSLQARPEEEHAVEVKALLSRDAVRPGEVFKAAVILKIRAGYHINDNAPADEFLFPTSLIVEETPGIEVLETYYPAGHRGRFAYSQQELVVYEGEAVLGLLLKAGKDPAPAKLKLKATLSYQACNNMSCLPPKELPFEIAVPFSSAGKEGRDLHPEIFDKIFFKTQTK